MAKKALDPAKVLSDLFAEFQIPIKQAATELNLSQSQIRQLISGKTKISIPVAYRLAKYFNLTVDYWANLQLQADLEAAKADAELVKVLKDIPKAKKQTPKPATKSVADAKKALKPGAKAKKAVKPAKKPASKPAPKKAAKK
jgi:addiction module HigA family antidote